MQMDAVAITRFPVKGMSGTRLDRVALTAGRGLPGDRRFGIARAGATGAESRFLGLTRHQRLASLTADFDETANILTIARAGRPVARGDVGTPAGRATIEQFFSAYMGKELNGAARLYDAASDPTSDPALAAFLDGPNQAISIINLASVRDLERVVAMPVDPRRFRANIQVDVAPAWCELDWVGRDIRLGDATMRIAMRTERCAATNVDPDRAVRDMNIPQSLRRGFGHMDLGVYGAVVDDGVVRAR